MKVAVIGGLGFIGSFVVESLINKGIDVVVVARSKRGLWRLKDLYEERAFELKYGDVLDPLSLKKSLRGVKAVINMVALISHKIRCFTYRVNFHGTYNVFKIAHEMGIRKIVHTSVAQVHLPHRKEVVKSLKYMAPWSEYLAGKIGGEFVSRKFERKGVESVILRPTVVVGPKSPHGLNTLILLSFTGLHPVTMGNGDILMNPIYVRDLAEAYSIAVVSGKGTFYVGGTAASTLREILNYSAKKGRGILTVVYINYPKMAIAALKAFKRFSTLMGLDMPIPTERGVVDTLFVHNLYDYKRFSEEFGWRPKYTLFQGIDETVEWYRKRNLTNPFSALKFLMIGKA